MHFVDKGCGDVGSTFDRPLIDHNPDLQGCPGSGCQEVLGSAVNEGVLATVPVHDGEICPSSKVHFHEAGKIGGAIGVVKYAATPVRIPRVLHMVVRRRCTGCLLEPQHRMDADLRCRPGREKLLEQWDSHRGWGLGYCRDGLLLECS